MVLKLEGLFSPAVFVVETEFENRLVAKQT